MKANGRMEGAQLRLDDAIAWIEAALQASLGAEDGANRVVALKALKRAGRDQHLEAWLETVAAELEGGAAGDVQAELVRTLAQRMLDDRRQFLNAHGPVDRQVIRSLVRRP